MDHGHRQRFGRPSNDEQRHSKLVCSYRIKQKPQGELPEGVLRIAAPTSYVWIIGRTQTNGPKDYEAVRKVQDGYTVTPLSKLGKTPQAVTATIDPAVDMKTPPMIKVDTMPADKYFAYAAELMTLHPPQCLL
jgi:hypothetical protein